jgi:hypothetical protein
MALKKLLPTYVSNQRTVHHLHLLPSDESLVPVVLDRDNNPMLDLQ